MDYHTDGKIGITQITIAGFGTASAKVAEHLNHFTLSDIASILTISYTAWLFYCSISDRLSRRRAKKKEESRNGRPSDR